MNLKRLLIFSYHFPPSPEVAGKPTARLVRHLSKFGWEAVVLTVTPEHIYGRLDHQGYADVLQGARVERVRPWRRLIHLVRGARALLQSVATPGGNGVATPAKARVTGLSRFVNFLEFPDKQAGWLLPSIRRANAMLRAEPFHAMMTVAPPYSALLAGLVLKQLHRGVPWLAQLHDPWAGNPFNQPHGFLLRRSAEALEARVVHTADRVLVATDEAEQAYVARYPNFPRRKFGVLENGYDPLDFPEAPSARRVSGQPLQFLYIGTLYGGRDPMPFLRGVAQLISSGHARSDELRVDFVGDFDFATGKPLRTVIDELGLADVVRISAPVPYPEALRRTYEADVLLLFAQSQPDQVPAKLFEYLHADRYVLAFTSGASARIVNETGCGSVIGSGKEALPPLLQILELHRLGRLAGLGGSQDKLRGYQAVHLAHRLTTLLDSLGDSERPCKRLKTECGAGGGLRLLVKRSR